MRIQPLESAMTVAFTNPTHASWSAIARRIVERGHITSNHSGPRLAGERDFAEEAPTKEEVRAEALKWIWQH
jgi:hypothetical protein